MAYIHRQVKMIAPVDSMQGMVGKQSDNVCQKAIIFNLRQAASSTNCGKPFQYFSVRTKVGNTKTAGMIAWQNRFGQICEQTRARMIDPTYMTQDRAEFVQQTKYKTLYQFVWNKVQAEVDA